MHSVKKQNSDIREESFDARLNSMTVREQLKICPMTTFIYSIFRSVGIGQKILRKVARQELRQTSEQYNGQRATEDLKYMHLYIYSFFFRNVRQKFSV